MEVIKLIVSKEKNLERLDKITEDPAFVACLLRLKGLKVFPTEVNIKIGIIKGEDYEKESGNTCGNCGKPDPATKLD